MTTPVLPNARVVYKRVTGANPAAGSELSDAVPAGKFWILLAYLVDLAQGTTQTPQPILQLDDGATVFYESVGSSAAQAVSTTCRYIWAPGHTLSGQIGAAAAIRSQAPLPTDQPLLPGYRIRTVTTGIGANTDYGAPSIFVAEVDLS